MAKKHQQITLFALVVFLVTTACSLSAGQTLPPTPGPTLQPVQDVSTQTPAPTSTLFPPTSTAAPTPSLAPTLTATLAPSPTEPARETSIAYVQNDSLLVTHVLGGKPLETREIIQSPQSGGIMNVGWSPSGEYLAFTMLPDSFPHVYIVDVQKNGKPIDLGIADLGFGKDWAWSPDSKALVFEHEYELWLYSPVNGTKKQLTSHLGTNWLWSIPVFTPDGKAVWAVGTDSSKMDPHGSTSYKIYKIPLDGSGAADYPPGSLVSVTEEMKGTIPLDLRFSPDGQKAAIITSQYIENCAKEAGFQLGGADGKSFHDLPVPSLAAAVGPNHNPFFYGDSLVWDPQSKGLWVNGLVRDCTIAATVVGGPQISYLTLDGQEHAQIPGAFSQLSIDHTGTLLGVVNAKDGSRVQILGADGHLVLDLGQGDQAALQP